jgi:branched-chain amino acid aminotransferase
MNQGICWLDGHIQPVSEARIPVLDHGLLYGDGVFEGVRFYHGKAFMLPEHLQRLFDSARAIGLDYPWEEKGLARIVEQVIAAFPLNNGYLRILITRGEGALGIDPRSCSTPRLLIIADRLQMIADPIRRQGADLIIATTRRLPPDGLDPRIKSLNYLNHILARMEANHAGAHEAILLNARGQVTEGTADNLFIVKNAVLLTPPVIDGALEGITRQLILDLAGREGLENCEQTLTPYDLHTAEECFLTGTGAELIPVRSIDGRKMTACPGALYKQLAESFRQYIDSESRI